MGCPTLGKAGSVPISAGGSKEQGDIIGVWLLVDDKVMKVCEQPHGRADGRSNDIMAAMGCPGSEQPLPAF
jgi:hypothetical protein